MPEPSSAKRTAVIFADAHPLAYRLFESLPPEAGPVLVVGDGSGRNSRALRDAGLTVVAIPDERPYTQLERGSREFAAALSTHAYLHGTTAKLRVGFAELARVLRPGASAFVTLGSIHDVRYGFGDEIDAHTFSPGDGLEQGIPHTYFDRETAVEVVRPFEVVRIDEVDVDAIVGKWAHAADEPPGKVHWFVEARKPL